MDDLFYKQFKIFVSSPSDVEEERKIVDTIISQINDSIGDSLKINLKIEKWEKLPPETESESIQMRLENKIGEALV